VQGNPAEPRRNNAISYGLFRLSLCLLYVDSSIIVFCGFERVYDGNLTAEVVMVVMRTITAAPELQSWRASSMLDLVFIALTLIFFALSFLYVRVCERL
jgi:hypothetical protein